jgi:Calcineurin-like phosphoesterase
VWRADFFSPAAKLLPVAPWVMVRGNHEDCRRGGKGWSRTLEPAKFDAESGCNGPTPLYTIRLPKMTLALVDTALAPEEKADPKQVELFREQYAGLAKLGADPIWLLQHRPIWSAGGTIAGFPFGDNKTLAAAARTTLPPAIKLMLSGHHHIFQALNYADGLPPQIVSGHGGDYLNTGHSLDPAGWSINGVTVTSGLHDVGTFGYVLMEPQEEEWVVRNFDSAGTLRHRCGLVGRQIACRKP